MFPIGKRWTKALDYTRKFTMKVMEERIAELTNISQTDLVQNENKLNNDLDENFSLPKKRQSFLNLLLKMHLQDNNFSIEEIQDEVTAFLFGGHDTTAVSMSWALYLLGLHKDIQLKVQNEIDFVLGTEKDINITLKHLMQMEYLESVVKESARLYPAVYGIGRTLNEDTELDGKIVPKGTQCFINISQVHRDPSVFPDPEFFNPDRFLNPTASVKEAFLLFSAGPRGCMGFQFAMMEMKMILCHILRKFTVKSLIQRDKIIIPLALVQKPIGGLPLIFKNRMHILDANDKA